MLVKTHETLFLNALRQTEFYKHLEAQPRQEVEQAVALYARHTGTNSELAVESLKKRFVGNLATFAKARKQQTSFWKLAKSTMIRIISRHAANTATDPFYKALEAARVEYAKKLKKLLDSRKKS